jgi:catechol 2,3-dioxygenase-like lactoylglutathione lyase family enzyme
MFDHIGLRVKDVEASAKFYEAALSALGHVLCSRDVSGASFGPKGAAAFYLYATGKGASATHVALVAKDRKSVDRFYSRGIESGGRDNGKPGVRADYAPNYYAAFLIDPDGNNVEAVCLAG